MAAGCGSQDALLQYKDVKGETEEVRMKHANHNTVTYLAAPAVNLESLSKEKEDTVISRHHSWQYPTHDFLVCLVSAL